MSFEIFFRNIIIRSGAFLKRHNRSAFDVDEFIASIITLCIFWILIANAPAFVVAIAILVFALIVGWIED